MDKKGATRYRAFLGSIGIVAKCEISQAFFTFSAKKIKTIKYGNG